MKILSVRDLEEGKVYISLNAITLTDDNVEAALLVTKKLKHKVQYEWLDGHSMDNKLYFYNDSDNFKFIYSETLNSPLAKLMRELE